MLNNQRWFHSSLNGNDAENLLLEHGHEGSFLVRPSLTHKDNYSLSVRRGPNVVHVVIWNNNETYNLYGTEFNNLTDLLQYYINNDLHEINGEIIRIKKPLYCAEFTRKRWYHGRLTPREAKSMLMMYGRAGSFLVRDSPIPGQFAIAVRVQNQVKHVKICVQNGKFDLGGGNQFHDLDSLIENHQKYPLVDTSGDVYRLEHPFYSTRIEAQDFHTYFKRLQEENDPIGDNNDKNGFCKEFKMLQIVTDVTSENMKVVLKEDAAGSYHIDANYIQCKSIYDGTENYYIGTETGYQLSMIPTFQSKLPTLNPIYVNIPISKKISELTEHVYNKTYIATLDCLSTNIDLFWSMIWQEDVRIIVKMTKEVKLNRYWPELHKTMSVQNNIEIYMKSETVTPDYTLRQFLVAKMDEGGAKRRIYQFHFMAWPGDVAPAPGHLLNLLFDINYKLEEIMTEWNCYQPMVCVHCTSGRGKTGAFIVIDMILDAIRREGFDCDIDIRDVVQMVREQRCGMIENEAQYEFIYMAVLEFIEIMKQKFDIAVNG